MAKKQNTKSSTDKKKTSIGNGKYTKKRSPGPNGGNKRYRKLYRGQGK